MKKYIVTVARGFGSGGKEIALKLSDKLGIPCYERQILTMASEKSGISEEIFDEVDEKVRGHKIAKFLGSIPSPYIVEPSSDKFTSDINLFNIQADIIRSLDQEESCIIVGKCANMILEGRQNIVSVYIEAPRQSCVDSVVKKMGVTAEEAEKLIIKTDRYRYDYYKFYTGGHDWRDPIAYDMTLNSAKMGRNRCVDLIADYVDMRFA